MREFTGSSPCGYKAEIRKAKDGFSLFTWFDTDATGLILWRENHGLEWGDAFRLAVEWLNTAEDNGLSVEKPVIYRREENKTIRCYGLIMHCNFLVPLFSNSKY